MNNRSILKLVVLLVCMAMVLSLFACNTPPVTEGQTEAASTTPADTDPIETDPSDTDPDETDSIETDPQDTGSTESDSVTTEPISTGSTESDSVTTEPIGTGSAESDTVTTESTESGTVETGSTETDSNETDSDESSSEETGSEETLPDDLEIKEYKNYDLMSYMVPYWDGNVVYNETVMFVGIGDTAPLMYDAKKIISVRSYDLKTEYVQGVDYDYVDGKLVLLEGTRIPYIPEELYYQDTSVNIKLFTVMPDGTKKPTMVSNGPQMAKYQVAVTYAHTDEWSGCEIPAMTERFESFISKLEAGEDVTIIFCGDSITTGAESSWYHNIGPNVPCWPMLFTRYIASYYGYSIEGVDARTALGNTSIVRTIPDCSYGNRGTITYINTAIGGWTTEQGRDNAEAHINDFAEQYGCDLLVLGFGMNNGYTKADALAEILKTTVMATRTAAPDADVLLISTMLPNIHVEVAAGYGVATQHTFEAAMIELANKLYTENGIGCAVAPMTSVSESILNVKRYRDTSANNINHPNDFMSRAYAQTLMQTVFGYDNLASMEASPEQPDNTKELTARELSMMAGIYHMVTPSYVSGVNGKYASFLSKAGEQAATAQIIYTRFITPEGNMGPAKPFEIGKAKYIVFKARCSDPSQAFSVWFSTADSTITKVSELASIRLTLDDEWVTYVIDIQSAFAKACAADADGNITVMTFYLQLDNMAAETVFDVQYVNFCDDWTEISAVADQDNVKFARTSTDVKDVKKNGQCIGEHSIVETEKDGTLVWACSVCGAEIAVKQIPEAANVYASAVDISNAASSRFTTSVICDDEEDFARIYGTADAGFNLYANAEGNVVTGQYLVLKYRIADNGNGQAQIIFYASTQNPSAVNERDSLKLMPGTIEDPTLSWRTAVIDLSQAVGCKQADKGTFTANGNGEYCAKFITFRPFATGSNIGADDYIDISHMAFCSSLEDAISMVDTASYEYYTSEYIPQTINVEQ